MRTISGRIEPRGPFIEATVMASPQHVDQLKALHLPVPSPAIVRALVDTGASSCVLDSGIISRLGLIQTGKTLVHTSTTGQNYEERDLYDASIFIGDSLQGFAMFTVGFVRSDLASEGFLAIIGWDILNRCILTCDGPSGTFTLTF
jgi:hypothetical protein